MLRAKKQRGRCGEQDPLSRLAGSVKVCQSAQILNGGKCCKVDFEYDEYGSVQRKEWKVKFRHNSANFNCLGQDQAAKCHQARPKSRLHSQGFFQ